MHQRTRHPRFREAALHRMDFDRRDPADQVHFQGAAFADARKGAWAVPGRVVALRVPSQKPFAWRETGSHYSFQITRSPIF